MLRWEYMVEVHYVLKISSQQITEFAFFVALRFKIYQCPL
jgi:hypothetical protein